jgi:hypothetical protein
MRVPSARSRCASSVPICETSCVRVVFVRLPQFARCERQLDSNDCTDNMLAVTHAHLLLMLSVHRQRAVEQVTAACSTNPATHMTVPYLTNCVVPCCRYLGGNPADLPHPGMDWFAFVQKLKELNRSLPPVFDPLANAARPWVDIKKLNATYAAEYGGGSSTCVLC